MRASLALILLVATTVRGEDNCGRMERYATRFRGTVRSVEILGERKLTITPIDQPDLRYAVAVDVAGLAEDNLALSNGAKIVFGVHSPTLTFADTNIEGKTFDLQAVWLACDGKLRRFEELVPAALRPVEDYESAGWLEVGHVYRGTAIGRTPDPLPTMPRHHMGGISWTNADAFLPDDEQRRTVVFEVTSQWIQHDGERSWTDVLDAKILEVR